DLSAVLRAGPGRRSAPTRPPTPSGARPGKRGVPLRRRLVGRPFGGRLAVSSRDPPPGQLITEVAGPGQVEHLGGQLQRPAVEAADVAGALDQVARLARPQLPALLPVAAQQPVD